MRNLLILIAITFCIGCAALAITDVPELSKRTLRINRNGPGFVYSYLICVKKFLGICSKTQMHTDVYDLTDPATRNKLADMGFVGIVRPDPVK